METLYLMRHGKAEPEGGGRRDRDRALTPAGRQAAAATGQRLAAAAPRPSLALVSGARRTLETWEAIAPALPGVEARTLDALYMAPPERLWDEAEACGAAHVLIVGHNPGLAELVQMLLAQSFESSAAGRALNERFPTSALAGFTLSGDALEAAGPRLIAAHLP